MRRFTIVERIPCRSRSVAARYYVLRNHYLAKPLGLKRLSQTAIGKRLRVSTACVNEQVKDLGLVGKM